MKNIFTKLLCYILVISIILPTFVISAPKVYAEETSTSEASYEGEQDSKSTTYKAGDWTQAYKDGCPYNFFHIKVQDYIINIVNAELKNVSSESTNTNKFEPMGKELKIHYKDYVTNPVTKKSTKTGSVDLSLRVLDWEDKEITYLWEVKPYSYFPGTKRANAEQQLANYLNKDLRIDSEANNDYSNGGMTSYIENGEVTVTAPKNNARYKITYEVCTGGLIFYKFEKIEEEKKPDDDDKAKEEAEEDSDPETDSAPSADSPTDSYEQEDTDKDEDDEAPIEIPEDYPMEIPSPLPNDDDDGDMGSGDGGIKITEKKPGFDEERSRAADLVPGYYFALDSINNHVYSISTSNISKAVAVKDTVSLQYDMKIQVFLIS